MFRSAFCKVVLMGIVLIPAILEAQPNPAPPFNRYIVQVTKGANPGQVGLRIAQSTRGRLGHVYMSAVKGFSVELPPGLDERNLKAQSGVLLVEPDVLVHAVAQTLPTGVDRIEADNSGATTPVDVDIAIIDTGIDIDHPDLNVVGGRHFYSLLGLISFEDDQYDDDNGHGSHCAGIAAARNNDIGVVGVAPGARLWAVKVLDSTGSGYLSDVIAGIDWVTAHAETIEIENMSLAATASSSIFRTAVQGSVNAGIVCVVAAGNDSKDVYGFDGVFGTSDDVIPAAYPEAATISAMVDLDGIPGGDVYVPSEYGYDDSFANFSNDSHSVVAGNPVTSPGKAIDLLMPGVSILSCYMNGGYAIGSGTSMASPHAAGLAALYIARYGRANNASEVYDIRQALIDGGVAQDDPERGLYLQNDFDNNHENIGWAAFTEIPTDNPPSVMIINPTDGETIYGSGDIIANASDDYGVTQVEFFVGEEFMGSDIYSDDGWSVLWDTTGFPDGDYTVSAIATDTIGQTSEDWINVTVENLTDNPPSVMITNPIDGTTIYGIGDIIANASDDYGVAQVEFFVGDEFMGSDIYSDDGWSVPWDTTGSPDGDYTVSAIATDTIGQTSEDWINVTVDNFDDPPSVMITDPTDGAVIYGSGDIIVDASDDHGVTQVEFFINGISIGVDEYGLDGWTAFWDTTEVPDDYHVVSAIATDTVGQTSRHDIEVFVDNSQEIRVAKVNVTAMPLLSTRRWWIATAMVTVTEDGLPVAGATIEGVWSGLYKKSASNVTDIFGFISFETGLLRKAGTVTFTVTRVFAPDGQEYVLDPLEPSGSTTGP